MNGHLQIGIRQRSLRRTCRFGRATELVFVLATGVLLTPGGQVQAQAVWSGAVAGDPDMTNPLNYAGNTDPSGDAFVLNNGAVANQPILDAASSLTVDSATVSAGTLTINGDLTTAGGVVVTGGQLQMNAAGASIIGDLDNSATTQITLGLVTGNASNSGTLNNSGTIGGNLTNTAGTTTNTGTIRRGATVGGGTLVTTGQVRRGITNSATVQASGDIFGANQNNAGTFTITGAAVANSTFVNAAQVSVTGGNLTEITTLTNTGTIDIAATRTLSADVINNNSTGTINVGEGATLEGTFNSEPLEVTLNNNAAINVATNGTVTDAGVITNSATGTLNFNGPGGTATLNAGGTINNAGTISVVSGIVAVGNDVVETNGTIDLALGTAMTGVASLNQTGGTINGSGGAPALPANRPTITVAGTYTQSGATTTTSGTIDINAGSFTQSFGTIGAGTFVTSAGVQSLLGGTIAGTLDGVGAVTVGNGKGLDTTTLSGTIVNAATMLVTNFATLNVTDTGVVTGTATTIDTGGTVTSSGTLASVTNYGRLTFSGTVNGNLDNLGRVDMTGSVSGNLTNQSGAFVLATGAPVVAGNLTNEEGATFSTANNTGGDVVSVTGNAVLNGTVELEADLSGSAAPTFDSIQVGGDLSGNVTLAFTNLGTEFATTDGLDILTYGGSNSLTFETNLPTTGAILFEINDVVSGTLNALQLSGGVNPAIPGLANGLALTQSLIGSVVNRPSSPFLTALAAEDDKPCGFGGWGRAVSGQADTSGAVQTGLGEFDSFISANYSGVQAGFDNTCFRNSEGDWDLSFGATVGQNQGDTTQPVFLFNPTTGLLNTSVVTSRNLTDFSQTYGGVYLGASKGRFFADLQYRVDTTDFDLRNVVAPGGGALGVADQTYTSRGKTLSGSMGYNLALNESRGVSLVPVLGFLSSTVSIDSLRFDQGSPGTADDGRLDITDIQSRIGFASLSLARSRVLPGQTSGIYYFGTVTLYRDFADAATSTYLSDPSDPTTAVTATSDNLGAYSELSLGLNYTKLLNPGTVLSARQLDAGIRVDGRFGDNIDGWGVTAQVRLQF